MDAQVLLKVEGMTRRFGGLVAVKDLSFEVREGEILGLIGPNGAGKSTTFNVVSGYYKPTSGRLAFKGGTSPAWGRRGSRARAWCVPSSTTACCAR